MKAFKVAAVAVAIAAVLAAGATGIIAQSMEQQDSVSENRLVNYDGEFAAP